MVAKVQSQSQRFLSQWVYMHTHQPTIKGQLHKRDNGEIGTELGRDKLLRCCGAN
jgi:hypothetical protein